MASARINTIDGARGLAMVFVMFSHFTESYLLLNNKPNLLFLTLKIGHIASPMFMLISGTLLGYLYFMNRDNYSKIRKRYVDRGLFLIIVAHLLILISFMPLIFHFDKPLKVSFVTDSIGLNMIVVSIVMDKLSATKRFLSGIILLGISWLVILLGSPHNLLVSNIEELTFGVLHHRKFFDTFPFIPWLGIYLIGSVLGERLGNFITKNYLKKVYLLFLLSGLAAIVIAFPFYEMRKLLNLGDYLHYMFTYYQKNPPSIEYFLFYGGISLIILSLMFILNNFAILKKIMKPFEIIGRSSLFVFVIQYYFYFFLLVFFPIPYTKLWPIIFIISLILVYYFSTLWDKNGMNKYITVLNLDVWRKLKLTNRVKSIDKQ